MAPTATAPFHAWDEELSRSVSYKPGDPVPAHVAAKVGDHVVDKSDLDDSEQVDTSAFDGEAFDTAVQAQVDERVEAERAAAVDEYRQREQAAYDAVTEGDPFDPSADGVKAKDVKEYLEGLDRDTVAGAAEYDRVVQAERDGENRTTAFPADVDGTE